MIEFWFDGVCEPKNPEGHCSYGCHIINGAEILLSEGKYLGHGKGYSNNVAEYSGFIRALEFLEETGLRKKQICGRGDSRLVIEQIQGYWKVRGGLYVPYYQKAKVLYKKFPHLKLLWIPREQNEVGDRLSKQPLRDLGIQFRIQPEV
jgi:ribonuclease HI